MISKLMIIVIVLVLLGVIGGVVYWYMKKDVGTVPLVNSTMVEDEQDIEMEPEMDIEGSNANEPVDSEMEAFRNHYKYH